MFLPEVLDFLFDDENRSAPSHNAELSSEIEYSRKNKTWEHDLQRFVLSSSSTIESFPTPGCMFNESSPSFSFSCGIINLLHIHLFHMLSIC